MSSSKFFLFVWKAEGIATTEAGTAKETTDGATSKADGRTAEAT